jgi:DNA-binding HxlR family transcriptional regulator
MENPIEHLEKVYDSRIRLGIMSVLMVNDWVDFNSLKELLETTDGNLASHLKALEKRELITVKKQFIGRKPKTSYRVTAKGNTSFQNHLDALEKIIKEQK